MATFGRVGRDSGARPSRGTRQQPSLGRPSSASSRSSGSTSARGLGPTSAPSSGPAKARGKVIGTIYGSPPPPYTSTSNSGLGGRGRSSGAPPPASSSGSAVARHPERKTSSKTPSQSQSRSPRAPEGKSREGSRSCGTLSPRSVSASGGKSREESRSCGTLRPRSVAERLNSIASEAQSRGSPRSPRSRGSPQSPRSTWRARAEVAEQRGDVRLELAGSPGLGGKERCKLSASGDFRDWLGSNSSIQELVLCWNNLGNTFAEHLADALRINKTLKKLDLSLNNIGSAGIKSISTALIVNLVLQELHLGFNKFGDAGALQLAASLAINRSLRFLDLCDTDISASGAEDLGCALSENQGLQDLHIGCNRLGCEGTKHIANGLRTNESLLTLRLYSNRVGDVGAAALGDALMLNSVLQELDLQDNPIGDNGARQLTMSLQTNFTLCKLDLTLDGLAECTAASFRAATSPFMRGRNCSRLLRSEVHPDGQDSRAAELATVQNLLACLAPPVIQEEGEMTPSPGKWEKVRPPVPPVGAVVRPVLKTNQFTNYVLPPHTVPSTAASTVSLASTLASSPPLCGGHDSGRRLLSARTRVESWGSASLASSTSSLPSTRVTLEDGNRFSPADAGARYGGSAHRTTIRQPRRSVGFLPSAPVSMRVQALTRARSTGAIITEPMQMLQRHRPPAPGSSATAGVLEGRERCIEEPLGSTQSRSRHLLEPSGCSPGPSGSCSSPRDGLRNLLSDPSSPAADATRRAGRHQTTSPDNRHQSRSPDAREAAEQVRNAAAICHQRLLQRSPMSFSQARLLQDSPVLSSQVGRASDTLADRQRSTLQRMPPEGVLAMYWPSLTGCVDAPHGVADNLGILSAAPGSPRDGLRTNSSSPDIIPNLAILRSISSSPDTIPERVGSAKIVDRLPVLQDIMDDNPQQGFPGTGVTNYLHD